MKLQVINIDGKKTEDIELSDKIFSIKPSNLQKNLTKTENKKTTEKKEEKK